MTAQSAAWIALALALFAAAPAFAADHNNLDAGRPLSFDDAEPIAFREQDVEVGLALAWPRGRDLGLGLDLEYLYGFAPNTHLAVGLHPSIGGRADTDSTRADIGDVSLGVFHSLNREYNGTPALAVRGDVSLPTGRDSQGAEILLRGIMSKAVNQYDRLHVNLDLEWATDPEEDEREFRPGLILGYSRPLGYPRRFDRTGLAEVAIRAAEETGEDPVVTLGLGLRQQVTVRSVLDLGVQADVAGSSARDRLRLIAGYSTAF